jgi:hypothetical protein
MRFRDIPKALTDAREEGYRRGRLDGRHEARTELARVLEVQERAGYTQHAVIGDNPKFQIYRVPVYPIPNFRAAFAPTEVTAERRVVLEFEAIRHAMVVHCKNGALVKAYWWGWDLKGEY